MIKRISEANTPQFVQPVWPDPKQDQNKLLFHKKPSLRKIVVMADYAATFENAGSDPKTALLTKLLAHPYVELYRYSENGPPEGTEQLVARFSELPAYVGWAVTHVGDDGKITVTSSLDGSSMAVGGVTGNLHTEAAKDTTGTAYNDLGATEAAKRRTDDAIAIEIARQTLNADIYITDRPYLYETKLPITKNILVVKPEDALPVISLYLRTQGEYFVDESDGVKLATSRWDFFWIATHELLSQSWRLYAACFQHSQGSSDSKPGMLEGTLQHRLCYALQARDNLHVAVNDINRDQNLVNEIESALFNLGGAFEMAAKIAHLAMGLASNKYYRAAWQNDDWLNLIDPAHSDLVDLVKGGSDGKRLLKLWLALRNTIHEESLFAVRVFEIPSRHIGAAVAVPPSMEQALITAADDLGGHEKWGIKGQAGRYIIDPDAIIDRLMPAMFELLDKLIEKTPLESLSHVSLSQEDCQPPDDPQKPFFLENSRKNIRWQLGI